MALQQYSFGSGKLYMVPFGAAVVQPIQVGTTQDVTLDLAWAEKTLQGPEDAAAAIARGALKLSGKIKAAKFSVADISSVIFGTAAVKSTTQTANNEGAPSGTAIPAPVSLTTSAVTASGSTLTFTATTGVVAGQSVTGTNIAAGTTVVSFTSTTVTLSQAVTGSVASGASIAFGPSITVVNAATFVDDLGVVNATTGVQMAKVASAPATGQYMVANGVYTFSTADAAVLVVISYSFTKTLGNSLTYYAQPMGFRPTFKLILSNKYMSNNPNYAGQPMTATVWNAGIDKFSLDFKNEDWTVPESDFTGSQDVMGRVVSFGADS